MTTPGGRSEYTRHQQGIIRRYYEHFDSIALQRLSEIVSDIYLSDANKPAKLWDRARTLLSRVAKEDPRVADILARKDIQGLARLVNELSAGLKQPPPSSAHLPPPAPAAPTSPTSATPAAESAAAAARTSSDESAPAQHSDPLSPDNLKRAMKAFRKRLKLTKLDDESRLGRSGSAMTGGRRSQVAAIMAPREFPKAVWDELVRQGKLKTADGVFYELAENA